MPWNVNHSTVEGLCPGMLVIHLLRAYASIKKIQNLQIHHKTSSFFNYSKVSKHSQWNKNTKKTQEKPHRIVNSKPQNCKEGGID